MVARAVAFIAAVAMVAGAFVYRYGVPGSAGSDGRNGGRGSDVVVCAAELEAICEAIPDAVIEPAAATADRLASAKSRREANVGAWLAPGPWAAMIEEQRSQDPLFDRAERLAHTDLVAVIRKGRPVPGCDPVMWKCIGDAAQDQSFRIGADPVNHSTGLFVRAAALSGFFGGSDYASNDIEVEAATWLANLNDRLNAAPGFGAESLQQFLVIPGSAGVYLTSAASAHQSNAAAIADVAAPQPVSRISATLASSGRVKVDAERLRAALEAGGWTPGPFRGDDGLPSPGVLLALRTMS